MSQSLVVIDPVNGGAIVTLGRVWTVDPVNGSDTGSGDRTATVTGAVGKASPGDLILLTPGAYVENVVIPEQKPGLTLVSAGDRQSATIVPEDGVPLTINGSSTRLIGLGLEASGTDMALAVVADRVRAARCKIEGGALGLDIIPRSVAAGGHGGSDCLFEDCEFAWSTRAVRLRGSDYGAATQIKFRRCIFGNIETAHFAEAVGPSGAAGVTFRDLLVEDCVMMRAEDGTAPTKFINLNADNANTGLFTGNRIAFATNEADVIALPSGVLWVANFTEAGVTAARPS